MRGADAQQSQILRRARVGNGRGVFVKIPVNSYLTLPTTPEVLSSGDLYPDLLRLSPAFKREPGGFVYTLYQNIDGLVFFDWPPGFGEAVDAGLEHLSMETIGGVAYRALRRKLEKVIELSPEKETEKEHNTLTQRVQRGKCECLPFRAITEVTIRKGFLRGRYFNFTYVTDGMKERNFQLSVKAIGKNWIDLSSGREPFDCTKWVEKAIMLWRFWLERQEVWEKLLGELIGFGASGASAYASIIESRFKINHATEISAIDLLRECEQELQSRLKAKNLRVDEVQNVVKQKLAHFAAIPWCAQRMEERPNLRLVRSYPMWSGRNEKVSIPLWKEFIKVVPPPEPRHLGEL
jgi:hypothetical protein